MALGELQGVNSFSMIPRRSPPILLWYEGNRVLISERMQWIDAWYPIILDREILPQIPQLVARRNGEFCVALAWEPNFIAEVCYHGYMPMGEIVQGRPLLLIKSHQQRSILHLENLSISRKLKRYARTLSFEINRDFSHCLQQIVAHHQPHTWLIKPLCNALIDLHQQPRTGVAFHSIEIYEENELVAGEIGYTTGAIYSSLAGFHCKNGTGSVQLALLGLVLTESQFAFWDLGMDVPYKKTLGAVLVDRHKFLNDWHKYRHLPTPPWSTVQLTTHDLLQKLSRSNT